jgi:hypothetical protein
LTGTAREIVVPRDSAVDRRILNRSTASNINAELSAPDTEKCRRSAQGAGQAESSGLAGSLDEVKQFRRRHINNLAGILYKLPHTLQTDAQNHITKHDEAYFTPRFKLCCSICSRH